MTKDEERIEKGIWKSSKNDHASPSVWLRNRQSKGRTDPNSWTCWRNDVFLAITLSWEGKKYTKGSEANRGERITGVIAGDEANVERERELEEVLPVSVSISRLFLAVTRRVHAYLFSARTLAWMLSCAHSVTSVSKTMDDYDRW